MKCVFERGMERLNLDENFEKGGLCVQNGRTC